MARSSAAPAAGASIDPEEVAKFSAKAAEWWDPRGEFRPLHRLNPLRLAFIRDGVAARFGRDPLEERPLKGLTILDVGCGGGLLCEPLSRLGATVTGIDAAEENVAVAAVHAEESGLEIDYRCISAEALQQEGASFDAVVSMEVVEHVADVEGFLAACAGLVAPGGALALATLNRTPKSFALAIVGAEYLLRWLPRGTHDWRKFLKPSEIAAVLRGEGVELTEATGVAYNPLNDSWRLAPRDLEVNYMLLAKKPA
jgi:2-polyprenyl-6-hydroxyphenyl methylase/3-demethylubiquinone-9 3-methyltransferase